uniref:Transposase MuDR plant domain-containing protein n=1 Tax=Arundo donax TaxID=35708 RepID=A0A0A9F6R0_ARUDO
MEVMSEDQLYVLLGLRDEDEREKQAAQEASNNAASKKGNNEPSAVVDDDTNGAAILVSDAIPDEVFISYDRDHPTMKIAALFPSMKDFRLVVRQYAINGEFELGTEKSCKKKIRGFCKGDECEWSIVGTRQSDIKAWRML